MLACSGRCHKKKKKEETTMDLDLQSQTWPRVPFVCYLVERICFLTLPVACHRSTQIHTHTHTWSVLFDFSLLEPLDLSTSLLLSHWFLLLAGRKHKQAFGRICWCHHQIPFLLNQHFGPMSHLRKDVLSGFFHVCLLSSALLLCSDRSAVSDPFVS